MPPAPASVAQTNVPAGTRRPATLRGTVASLRLKRAAGRAAARVRGVAWFANELQVQIPDADRRDDDLRGDVPEALMLDVSVPMTVDAQARDGFVTLTGTAAWHHQREAAESRTTDVPGVAGIDNAITLTQAPVVLRQSRGAGVPCRAGASGRAQPGAQVSLRQPQPAQPLLPGDIRAAEGAHGSLETGAPAG
jgi:hypothetical protein